MRKPMVTPNGGFGEATLPMTVSINPVAGRAASPKPPLGVADKFHILKHDGYKTKYLHTLHVLVGKIIGYIENPGR